ncbi:hypothetical protein BU17DRAFT_68516 [Hysterangium stoloniferum]|nr:hypothetical protein BU17DRAFT_68516 [Hysterangium stoloniferum]
MAPAASWLLNSVLLPTLQVLHVLQPRPTTWKYCPEKMDIPSWFLVLRAYAVSDVSHAEDACSPAMTTVALELRRIKELDRKEHEFFIAKMRHVDGSIRYLRIDRRGEDYEPGDARWLESFREHPASDEMSSEGGWPNGQVLEKANVSKANITLIDLAAVGSVVRSNDDQYRGLNRQSHWFSDTIMRVLELTYGFAGLDRSSNSDRVWAANEYTTGGTSQSEGLPSYRLPRREHIAIVARKFREELDRTRDVINMARQQDPNAQTRLNELEEEARAAERSRWQEEAERYRQKGESRQAETEQ